ncbi:MAG: DNA-directed RNA polymerase subunit L [Euryarchaeota archaeon]|nr:DNA-directed RNA polymerase subunit L [Euryarchaeota archaeon]
MNVKIIEKTDNEISMEIGGESHTLLNTLKSTLLEDPGVELVTYDIKHPNISEPILYVRTKDVDPITAIKEASQRLVEVYEEFKTVIIKETDK